MVALLRGINVGRAKRVGMVQLRDLVQSLGYTDVVTHLQSGNVVFAGTGSGVGSAARSIELALSRDLDVQSTVIVRSASELAAAVDRAPLLELMTNPSRFLVGFMSGDPAVAGLSTLAAVAVAPDHIRAVGRHVYLGCPAGVLASPLNRLPLERMLGVAVTMRNWNTVLRLRQLLSA